MKRGLVTLVACMIALSGMALAGPCSSLSGDLVSTLTLSGTTCSNGLLTFTFPAQSPGAGIANATFDPVPGGFDLVNSSGLTSSTLTFSLTVAGTNLNGAKVTSPSGGGSDAFCGSLAQ